MDIEQKMFIKRLTELMEEFNMTQIDLAKKIKTTNVTISRYLSGERKPRIEIVTKIANVFSVSSDYLLGLSDSKNIIIVEGSSEKEFLALFEEYKKFNEEDKNLLKTMFEALKKKRKK